MSFSKDFTAFRTNFMKKSRNQASLIQIFQIPLPYLVKIVYSWVPGYPENRYPKYPEPGNEKVRVIIGRSNLSDRKIPYSR